MTATSSFDYGVAALMAHASAMDAIGANIANLRTPGYKRVETSFAAYLDEAPTGQIAGGGVSAQFRMRVATAGPVEQTGDPRDLALLGDGMFVYATASDGGGETLFSRRASIDGRSAPDAATGTPFLSAFDGMFLMGWPLDRSGAPVATTRAAMTAIPVSPADVLQGRATQSASLSALIPVEPDGPVEIPITYHDATFQPRALTLTLTRDAPGAWTARMRDQQGGQLGAETALAFDGTGVLTTPDRIAVGDLFTLDLAQLVQRGTNVTRIAYREDGFAGDALETWTTSPEGILSGRTATGETVPLYRLPIAQFANTDGLEAARDGVWRVGDTSGTPVFAPAPGTVAVLSGAIESSNVDLGDAFAQMIMTQRAYASAAQIVRTADEMERTIRDLR
jgi:flagellar hook protein FlgE